MEPNIALNWAAIALSVVAAFVFGSLWYGPLFGKVWRSAIGFATPPSGAEIAKGSVLNIVGTIFAAYVLAYEIAAFKSSNASPAAYGFFAAFFNWLGFVLPVLLNGVAFERKKWSVVGIAAGYQLLSLILMGMIIAHWR